MIGRVQEMFEETHDQSQDVEFKVKRKKEKKKEKKNSDAFVFNSSFPQVREFVLAKDVDVEQLKSEGARKYVLEAVEAEKAGLLEGRELFDTGRTVEHVLGAMFRFNLSVALGRSFPLVRRFLTDSPAHYFCM